MSAALVAPQALQDPAAESIEPPSVDRELARTVMNNAGESYTRPARTVYLVRTSSIAGPCIFTAVVYNERKIPESIAQGGKGHGHRGPKRDQGS